MSHCRRDRDDRTQVYVRDTHTDPAPEAHPAQCRGCLPCERRHCTVCTRHLQTDEIQTCVECLGQARRDLRELVPLAARLPDHALHGAAHAHLTAADPIPGGDALVLLGSGSEGLAEDGSTQVDLDVPVWILAWWEEDFRERLDLESLSAVWRRRADHKLVESQAFLDQHLGWAAAHHPGFHVLTGDLKRTRARLEEVLHAGTVSDQGVACFKCGATLEREYRDPKRCTCGPRPRGDHIAHHRQDACCLGCAAQLRWERQHATCEQGGLADTDPHAGWVCPRCDRSYTTGEYQLALRAKHDEVAEYRLAEDAARLTGAKLGSIRGWASGGTPKVRKRRDDSGRVTYNLGDIRSRLAELTQVLNDRGRGA